jgi:hypothetical protein
MMNTTTTQSFNAKESIFFFNFKSLICLSRQPTEQSPSRDRIYHHHRHSNQYRGTSAGDLLDELELRELDDRYFLILHGFLATYCLIK